MTRLTLAGAVLAGAVLAAGCGGDDEARVCASEGGASACLVDGSGNSVRLEAGGFQPGSELRIGGLAGEDQVGKVVNVSDQGEPEDQIGYVHPSGPLPELVVTVEGTSRSGAPVLLTLTRRAG